MMHEAEWILQRAEVFGSMTLCDPHHIEHPLGQYTLLHFMWYRETKNKSISQNPQSSHVNKTGFFHSQSLLSRSVCSSKILAMFWIIFSHTEVRREGHASIPTWVYFHLVRIDVPHVFIFLCFLRWASLSVHSDIIYFGQLHLPVILYPWNEWCRGIRQHISNCNQVLQSEC